MSDFEQDRDNDALHAVTANAGLRKLVEVIETLAKGQILQTLPDEMECADQVADLLAYMKDIQSFILSISHGEFSMPIKCKGPIAGALKSLDANLRHLTWQAKMIASGDLTQRVDFMGEFSVAFNTMVDNLREARDQLIEKNDELQRLNEEMREDLLLAQELQNATMNFSTDSPFLRSTVIFRPYSEVSGDFYDVSVGGDHESLNLFLGDATGHGVSAALVTMMVKMGISSLPRGLKTDEVLRRLNRVLNPCLPAGRFLTGIYMRITPEGAMSVCNAAHPPLLIVPSNGKETVIFESSGLPMGIFPTDELSPYEEQSYALQPGDRLFLYTDGVTECRRAKQCYGVNKLISFLETRCSLPMDALLNELLSELTGYTEQDRFDDDLTMIGFQYM